MANHLSRTISKPWDYVKQDCEISFNGIRGDLAYRLELRVSISIYRLSWPQPTSSLCYVTLLSDKLNERAGV